MAGTVRSPLVVNCEDQVTSIPCATSTGQQNFFNIEFLSPEDVRLKDKFMPFSLDVGYM